MEFRDLTYAQAEAAYNAQRIQIDALQIRVEDLERRLGVRKPEAVPLRHFATLAELEAAGEDAWERIPEEEAALLDPTGFGMQLRANLFNEKMRAEGKHLPFRNVFVDELGSEVARMGGTGWDAEKRRGGNANDDCDNIIHLRLLNAVSPIWMRLVQPGDNNWEGDLEDQKALMRAYAEGVRNGTRGLRWGTGAWEARTEYAPFLAIFREVYGGDYDPGNPKRQIPVTDV